jgi:hypothetical protein
MPVGRTPKLERDILNAWLDSVRIEANGSVLVS